MKRRMLSAVVTILTLAMTPVMVLARNPTPETPDPLDGRLEGYPVKVTLYDRGGSGLMWLLLTFLALICVGVMFKNAKRSHLD